MSYTPTQWQTGDTITAERLNKMENGIAEEEICLVAIHYNTTLQRWILDSPSLAEMESEYNSGKRLVLAATGVDNAQCFYPLVMAAGDQYMFASADIHSGDGTGSASCYVMGYKIYANTGYIERSASYPYTKPSGGIPETDLASTVAAKLNKAQTAFAHTSFVQALDNGWEVQAEIENADIEMNILNVGACFLIVKDANAEEWYIALTEIDHNGKYVGIGEINGRVVRVIADGTDHALVQYLKDEPLIVTLTPTAPDYSGTMDMTPADIGGAISAGQRIMFDVPSLYASVEATQFVSGVVACANITYAISGQDVLIQIVTSASDATYSTKIFPLTPMS